MALAMMHCEVLADRIYLVARLGTHDVFPGFTVVEDALIAMVRFS